MITNVFIVIRSVKERTEGLCRKLIIEQGVAESNISIVNEVPFSEAMRKGFELGLDSGCKWTYCIDADVLLSPGSIKSMISLADDLDENVCEIQGKVFDKFFGGPRPAGNHFYRTCHLNEVIRHIPVEGVNVRPEFYTLESLKSVGLTWQDVNISVGIHDSEQFYRDIYRKCFVQAHKHTQLAELFVHNWRGKSNQDPDMKVALAGFADGIQHSGDVRIDISQSCYSFAFERLGLKEKEPINLDDWNGIKVTQLIEEWQVHNLFYKYFPLSKSNNKNSKSKLNTARQLISTKGPLLGPVYLGGLILNTLGSKIMRSFE